MRRILISTGILCVFFGILLIAQGTFKMSAQDSGNSIPKVQGRSPVGEPAHDICDNMYAEFCLPAGETFDPTGSVREDIDGERRAASIYSSVIKNHPNWTSDEVDEEIVRQIFTPKKRARLEAAFKYASAALQKYFQLAPQFTTQEKKAIIKRIKRTHLQLPPPAALYADEPDLLTKNEVFYERTSTGELRLRVGGAYLFVVRSWFNLVFTMAHELAHSIDPCEIRSAHLSFPAYDHLVACLLDRRVVATRTTRTECGSNDQLSEVFADWFAVQITAGTLETFSTEFDGQQILQSARNSVRDLCAQDSDDTDTDLEFYPSPATRIQMFGKNPQMRSVLGCKPLADPSAYCTFDWKKDEVAL